MELTEILQKITQVLAYTEEKAKQKLLNELGKVAPCKEKTDIEGRIGWNYDRKEGEIYSNISLKLSPCAPKEPKDLMTSLGNILENAKPELLAEIKQAMDYLLLYAEKPYFLHISPTILIGETGIIRFYFLGKNKNNN